jgi:hypothetical protein
MHAKYTSVAFAGRRMTNHEMQAATDVAIFCASAEDRTRTLAAARLPIARLLAAFDASSPPVPDNARPEPQADVDTRE